jgi:hypothetical protein
MFSPGSVLLASDAVRTLLETVSQNHWCWASLSSRDEKPFATVIFRGIWAGGVIFFSKVTRNHGTQFAGQLAYCSPQLGTVYRDRKRYTAPVFPRAQKIWWKPELYSAVCNTSGGVMTDVKLPFLQDPICIWINWCTRFVSSGNHSHSAACEACKTFAIWDSLVWAPATQTNQK